MAPSNTSVTTEIIQTVDLTTSVLNINMSNVTKLSSTNYLTWSIHIKALLRGYNLLKFLDSSADIPPVKITVADREEPSPASIIKLSKNPVLHGRSERIHVRYHFLHELVNEGVIALEYCTIEELLSDIMTKTVKLEVFEKLRTNMGVCLWEE
ncbi:hypothetical protein Bca101_020563 [Brassica carinata]